MTQKISFHQLKGIIKKEENNQSVDYRKEVIKDKLGKIYDSTQPSQKVTQWEYATLYYPREKSNNYGSSEGEFEELKVIGLAGWEMVNFQIYLLPALDPPSSVMTAEYVFKRKIL